MKALPAPRWSRRRVFERALDVLMAAYAKRDLFRLVTYDAGACSKENALAIRKHGLHHLLAIKSTQPTLYTEAVRWLGARQPREAVASSTDLDHGRTVVRRAYLGEATSAPQGWEHLQTVLRVEVETFDASGARVALENRYFVSSLRRSRLTDAQWLLIVRRHWGVETSHQILDGAFAEDDHPWIEQKPRERRERSSRPPRCATKSCHPRATAVVMVLRRIAYTLLTLWRGLTPRSDEQRTRPWRDEMFDTFIAVVTATVEQLRALRCHRLTPVPAKSNPRPCADSLFDSIPPRSAASGAAPAEAAVLVRVRGRRR